MINPFYKSRLIYKISQYINEQRTKLLNELVAAVRDPVLYEHKIQLLTDLASYEHRCLINIHQFETDNETDLSGYDPIELLKREVDVITETWKNH
jgi:hypothetical protein